MVVRDCFLLSPTMVSSWEHLCWNEEPPKLASPFPLADQFFSRSLPWLFLMGKAATEALDVEGK